MKDVAEKYSAPALEKGLDILELLANEPAGVSKSEIARRLDRTISEIFRMLAVLEKRGFIVTRNGADKYVLSLKMFELSHRDPPIRRLSTVAAEAMLRLSQQIGQSCHIVVYYLGKGHVVVQQDPPTDLVFTVRLGTEVSLFGSCSGNVLLAFSDADIRRSMVDEMPTGHKRPTADELASIVERIREQGYEMQNSPRIAGSVDVAFPIFDYSGQIIAALSVPILTGLEEPKRTDLDAVIEAVGTVSREISSELGYNPPA